MPSSNAAGLWRCGQALNLDRNQAAPGLDSRWLLTRIEAGSHLGPWLALDGRDKDKDGDEALDPAQQAHALAYVQLNFLAAVETQVATPPLLPVLSAHSPPMNPVPSVPAQFTHAALPASTSSRSRYVIERRANGSYGFELRAHNGHCLLSSERDEPSLAAIQAMVERVRALISQGNAQLASANGSHDEQSFVCRQSLTGKWYFVVREPVAESDGPEQVLASSKPFDYRSRMDKALYAVRVCAPGSRVVVAEA